MLTYPQAILLGVLQGVTELFPVSSLGHSVLLPALLGWDGVVAAQSAAESYWLAFLVGLHVATALALLVYYRETWSRLLAALVRTLRTRRVETPDERLVWLLALATVPAGLVAVLAEHALRVLFARPLAASLFLVANGLLLRGEWARRRGGARGAVAAHERTAAGDRRLDALGPGEALGIGVAQVLALLPGFSRSGVTMVAGLVRGLDHKDAARFSFLLATPIILAAGLYKIPDLLGPNGDGVRPQVLAGSVAAALAAYASVRFLSRWFRANTLLPFAMYSLVVGTLAALRFALVG